MSLSAWRVNCAGQHLLVAEHTMVEFLNSAKVTKVPGGEGRKWSAVTHYNNEWVPVMCWQDVEENTATPLLVLHMSKNVRMALTVSESPVRMSVNNENFINDESLIPEQWQEAVVSCIESNGEVIPIIAPDKLGRFQ